MDLSLEYSMEHYQFKASVKTDIHIFGELSFIAEKTAIPTWRFNEKGSW